MMQHLSQWLRDDGKVHRTMWIKQIDQNDSLSKKALRSQRALREVNKESELVLFLSGLGMGIFFLLSYLNGHLGFPLDDSWIHQTYARNLAEFGEFSFIPGQPSAGSTSPLWTGVLAIGYQLHLPHLTWTFLMGWLSLSLVALMGMILARRLSGNMGAGGLWIGGFLALEWHLLWASASGMETLLYSGVILSVFVLLFSLRVHWFWAGLLIGVSIWLRPDGLTLMGPLGWVIFFTIDNWRERLRSLAVSLAGILIGLLPYLAFNQWLAGSPWPNTFSAKQTEYAGLQALPLFVRLWEQFQLPLIGAGAILAPGILYFIVYSARQRNWAHFAALLWAIGFMGIYAWRLPVTYQHGRYIMPVMPVLFVLGLLGLYHFVISHPQRIAWVVSRAWLVSLVLVQLTFLFLGARAYARDVAWIQTEMVQAADWIAENTQPDDLIAAHDIGALGYFSERDILDLAGLISPEVIPFIKDEMRLAEYLDQKQVDYLMTFPSWYPFLANEKNRVYFTGSVTVFGTEPMTIYKWRPE